MAGTGKSTIARTVARRSLEQKRLGASFFFSKGGGDVGHTGKFVTSIAVQLANNVPALRQHICDAVSESRDISTQSLSDQWRQLVLGPLSKLAKQSSHLLIVDALDECDDDRDIQVVVQLLAEAPLSLEFRLRVFLTSRPEVAIQQAFSRISDAQYEDMVLHDISRSIVDKDIAFFLKHEFCRIARDRKLPAGWPGEGIIAQLVQSASGLFIWAAIAARFVRDGGQFPRPRLGELLASNSGPPLAPEKYLDEIYITVLKNSVSPTYTDEEKEEHYKILRYLLGSIVILFSPLSAQSLDNLLCAMEGSIDQMLESLHAIIDAPSDQARQISFHPSFRDFILDENRCSDINFWVNEEQAHAALAVSCIKFMTDSLKRDLYGLDSPGTLVSEVQKDRARECLPSELEYACSYWVVHLQKGGFGQNDCHSLHLFLKEHFLHWLEALGWMGKISDGIYAIGLLESLVQVSLPAISDGPLLTFI
jgi:hypothetical protein